MNKIDNEYVIMFDVDETLVLDPVPGQVLGVIKLVNPYDNSVQRRLVHLKHVELLKQMHGRGRFICVWSGGGVQWASTVVQALGLEPYVHMIMTKPIGYVDDMQSSTWLNNQIYLKP